MYFCIDYSEGGDTYTLYSVSRKDAETLILQLLAEGYRDVRLLARPKRSNALARLVLRRPKLPLWERT
jgi:hypothetical protein